MSGAGDTKAQTAVAGTIHTVYIVNLKSPTRPILEIKAEVKVCKKMSWVESGHTWRQKRYLLGTSAFYTRKAAERAKIGLLDKMVRNTVLASMWGTRHIWESAFKQVKEFRATGTVH